MITGSIWEKDVFGRYLFAPAFFWEDVFSMLVLALHTAYLVGAVHRRARRPRQQMLLALAAYATYVVNAGAVPAQAARGAARRARRARRRGRPMESPHERRASPIARRRPTACADAPVLRERGQREVFCGLTGIVWLHRKIQDAFFLVVGSRTCAHLIQSAAGVMIFAEPRFATAIIEERDLAGLADANDELDRVVDAAARAPARHQAAVPGRLLPVRSDQARSVARRRSGCRRRFTPRVRVLNYSGSGIETTFTQGEDACLAALVPEMPAARRRRRSRCWWSARWPTWSRTSSAACSTRSASARCDFLPPRRAARPAGRRAEHALPAGPALPRRHRRARSRRAARSACAAPVPARRRRHHRLAAGRGRRAFGVAADALRRRHRARRERARQRALARASRRSWPASASSSSPIRSSRCRWRASCRASSAWSWSKSARPTCTASTWPPNWRCCRPALRCREGQDVERQLDRCRAAAPDLVVCGLGLANPLEAEGMTTKWSIELVFTPIQGYEQAADLAELFARPLRAPRAAGGLNRCS